MLTSNVAPIYHESFARFAPDGTLIPLVAESWSAAEDGLSYNFTIRDDAKWSDGTDVTVADVEFRYELLKVVPGSDQWGIAPYIDQIEEVDDKNFIVHLTEVFSPFLYYFLVLVPSPAHYWETVENFMATESIEASESIGTGPFKIVGFSAGDTVLRLVPNEYYWGTEPYLENITITLLSPDANVPALMAAGDYDIIEVPSTSQVASLVSIPDVSVEVFPTQPYGGWQMARWAGVLVNCLQYPLSEVDFRQAIAYSIDRQQITDLTAAGYGAVASYGFLPSDYTEWLAPDLPTYPKKHHRSSSTN
jgi:peptide/nickel transport system substrate-binding protein